MPFYSWLIFKSDRKDKINVYRILKEGNFIPIKFKVRGGKKEEGKQNIRKNNRNILINTLKG